MKRPILDEFTEAYATCALWLLDENPDPGEWSEHGRYTLENVAPETLARMQGDCERFQKENPGNLGESGLTDEQAGYDFWLSRNGHGAGFFDRGDLSCFDWLQNAASAYETFDLYFGDDGRIHGM